MTTRIHALSLSIATSLVALALAAPPAAAQTTGQQQTPQGQKAGDPTRGARNDTKSANFVKQAATSDMFEIEAAKLALQKSQNSGVRQFAQKMIDEHSKMSEQVKAAATQDKVAAAVPGQLDNAHTKKLDELRKLNGAAFDRKYVEEQVKGHKAAATLFENYGKSGEDANLKKTVNEGLPHIKQHLQQAETLQRQVQTAEVPSNQQQQRR